MAKWGDLDAANKACAVGLQQPPIEIEIRKFDECARPVQKDNRATC
jgi:carbonic anhydrase